MELELSAYIDAAWDRAWQRMADKVGADFPSWEVLHGPYGYYANRGDETVSGRTTAVIRENLRAAQRPSGG